MPAPPDLPQPSRAGWALDGALLLGAGLVVCALIARSLLPGILLSLAGAGAWLALAAGVSAWRRRARPLVAPAALLAGLLGFVASGVPARVFIFPGCDLPLEGPAVEYASDDGVPLRGLLLPGVGPAPRPALVFLHGNGDSAATVADVGSLFAAAGFDTFVAEFRGYGGCPGDPSEAGWRRDARAAVRVASERTGVAPADLVLVGQSLGTGVAAALAAEGVGRTVVLLSPYTSILELAGQRAPAPLAWLAVRDVFDSRARLLAARQPVLVLHGTSDTVIGFEHGAALVEALGARARLVRLEGCDHDVFTRQSRRIVEETLAVSSRRE